MQKCKENQIKTGINPVIYSDFPDPDIIRVEDTYYMASTTMHYMPGCDILCSYDLIHWEFLSKVYEVLDDTDQHLMKENLNIYGEGMWAPTFRYHKGIFYVGFTANDTHKTYLYHADNPQGPWKRIQTEEFYYDSSLFFDDDDKIYIVHGQKTLYLTELKSDLSGPRPGGIKRIIAVDEADADLGYEGCHMYKKDGRYYIFTCHVLHSGNFRKTEDVLISESLTGEFKRHCVLDDDMGYHNLGVAQGGMIDTPGGEWYAFMFQDKGALGRAPVLMPMHFENEVPVLGQDGRVPKLVSVPSTRPEYIYQPINGDDDFVYKSSTDGKIHLKPFWQFNHVPHDEYWSVTERKGAFRLYSGKISPTIMQAYNILTQRTVGPSCAAEVTVDASGIKEGDFAGISTFIGNYGMIAITKESGKYYIEMVGKPAKNDSIYGDFDYEVPGTVYEKIEIDSPIVKLRAEADFENKKDEAYFLFKENETWKKLGIEQKMYFKMDHFTGCRFGLFLYATEEIGGTADFMDFRFIKK